MWNPAKLMLEKTEQKITIKSDLKNGRKLMFLEDKGIDKEFFKCNYIGLKEIIIIITFCMNCVRELPPEYIENCPVIDSRYKVLFKLGSGRFSKYS